MINTKLGAHWERPFSYRSKRELTGSGLNPEERLHQNNLQMPFGSSLVLRRSQWNRRLWILEISPALWNK